MHRHRRANSYSQGGASGVGSSFWKLGNNAISSENICTQTTPLARATPERRSTGRRGSTKGYGAVTICKPAAIKFAVYEDPWVTNDVMALRPRSPSASKSRNGSTTDMQQLDQTMAFIREQLLGLKSERTQLSDRLDTLVTDISRTEDELAKQQAITAARRRSPGTPLRRIQSMDQHSSSRITISTTDSSLDLFDDLAMEIIDNTDSGSSTPSSTDGGCSPVFPPRRLHSGSSQSLPRSYSPRLDKKDMSTEVPFPKVLVSPRRSYSVGRRGSASTLQRTPSPFFQLEEIKEGESSKMLSYQRPDRLTTAMGSISGSLLSLPQCVLSPELKMCIDLSGGAWDSHSVVMRVSSATGQLEEVPNHSKTLPRLSPKLPTTKIMNLSEEPQAVIGRRRDSVVSNNSYKRHSIVLDSVVTDV